LIELSNISYTYNSTRFSLSCKNFIALRGNITCIIGCNGSGKSTLLKLIAGKLGHFDGSIHFDGKPLSSYNKSDLMRLIGWIDVSASDLLIEEMTLKEHIALALLIAKIPVPIFYNGLKQEYICNNLSLSGDKLLELTQSLNKKTGHLSAGQKQMVSIVLGIIGEKKVILCDESTAHLDAFNARSFFEEMKTLAQMQKAAFIIVTHDLLLAAEYSDRIYLSNGGAIEEVKLNSLDNISLKINKLKEIFYQKKSK